MHQFVLLTLVAAYAVAGPLADIPNGQDLMYNDNTDVLFDNFKARFSKQYESVAKEDYRRQKFTANVDYIREHNRKFLTGEKSFYLGINAFTDLAHKEFLSLYSGSKKVKSNVKGSAYFPKSDEPIPDALDWRKEGYVTPVREQGRECLSDWAISTTGALEGQLFKYSSKLIPLSVQQLLDCSGNFSNHGCTGGLPTNAYRYISAVGGIESEEDYPHEGKVGTCKFNESLVKVSDFGWAEVKSGDEVTLQQATALDGPMSVRIDASSLSFYLYKGGIYDEPSCSSTVLNHGALVVGYNTNPDYWIVKNSWGTQWGEDGYIRMSRNKNNQCGIATNATYPFV